MLRNAECATEIFAGARKPHAYCPNRNSQNRGCFGVGHALQTDEKKRGTLFLGQFAEGAV